MKNISKNLIAPNHHLYLSGIDPIENKVYWVQGGNGKNYPYINGKQITEEELAAYDEGTFPISNHKIDNREILPPEHSC